jgi:SAM-dependent methyltransferase
MQAALSMYAGSPIVVHGLDISPSAVELSRRHLGNYGLDAIVTEGSAIDMPYPPGSIDVFVLSAIMHEIYSYVPDGRQSWIQAIREVADKSSPDGILLLRDFAAPDYDGPVRLVFRSPIAAEFYKYFSREFRAFSAADNGMREAMLDRRSGPDSYLPALTSDPAEVELPASAAAEVMLHFKNFSDHVNRGFTFLGDQSWKEVNEAYLPPDPLVVGFYPMMQPEYVSRVESVMANTLRTGPYSMICVENGRSGRPNDAAFLAQHFVVSYPNSTLRSEDVIAGFTCKMELVFRKVSP